MPDAGKYLVVEVDAQVQTLPCLSSVISASVQDQTQGTTSLDSTIDMCSLSILIAGDVRLPISSIMCRVFRDVSWMKWCFVYPLSGPHL